MSNSSPYMPPASVSDDHFGVRKVKVKPIELLKRGYALIAGRFWMFLGIVLVGMIIGSAVPFGILMGPVIVGIFLCYIQQEKERSVEFSTLFKGFDQFVDSLFAFLIMLAVSMVVIIPFMVAIFAIMIGPILAAGANAGNNPPPTPEFPLAIFILYPLMMIANMAITLPFMFTFQLIADRKYKPFPAVKASARGVLRNLGGIIWFMVVLSFISLIAMLMCYFPVVLLMPISFAAVFVLYRDIYGGSVEPAVAANPNHVSPGQIV